MFFYRAFTPRVFFYQSVLAGADRRVVFRSVEVKTGGHFREADFQSSVKALGTHLFERIDYLFVESLAQEILIFFHTAVGHCFVLEMNTAVSEVSQDDAGFKFINLGSGKAAHLQKAVVREAVFGAQAASRIDVNKGFSGVKTLVFGADNTIFVSHEFFFQKECFDKI